MTLLSIATNVLKKNKASELPTTIIDNNNDTAKLVFAAIEDATQGMLYDHLGGWQILMKTYTFETVNSQQTYVLPSDILENCIIPNSGWNATTRFRMDGPVSPMEWQTDINLLLVTSSVIQRFIIKENLLWMYPTPTETWSLNYLYISENCIQSVDGSPQSDWQADTDTSLLNEYAIQLQASWRYLKQLGRAYEEEKTTADEFLAKLINQDGGRKTIYVNQQSIPSNYPIGSWLPAIIR